MIPKENQWLLTYKRLPLPFSDQMYALVPLFLTLALIRIKQLKTDSLYKANVYSIVGFCFFVVIQYALYWFKVFPTDSVLIYSPGTCMAVIVIALAYSPWLRKSHPIKTLAICSLFTLALIFSYSFDVEIKEKLAELGGFYKPMDREDFLSSLSRSDKQDTDRVDAPRVGASLQLSSEWKTNKHSTGHTFFTLTNGDTSIELRPSCLENASIDMPSYMNNILHSYTVSRTTDKTELICKKHQSVKTCLVKVLYRNNGERWLFVKTNTQQKFGSTLDIVIEGKDKNSRIIAESAIASLKTNAPNDADFNCSTPAAWI